MLKINNELVNEIISKKIKVINSSKDLEKGYELYIEVKYKINNIDGYFTIECGFEKNNDLSVLLNKKYKGNYFNNSGSLLLESFDTNNYYDSEIVSDTTVALKQNNSEIHATIELNDPLLKILFDDELMLELNSRKY